MNNNQPVMYPSEWYDQYGITFDQVFKYGGRYYVHFHGTSDANWTIWHPALAYSDDLIHWTKYSGNPINISYSAGQFMRVEGANGTVRYYAAHNYVYEYSPIN